MAHSYVYRKSMVNGVEDSGNPLTFTASGDVAVKSYYLEVNNVGTVTISGTVSQKNPRQVTVTVVNVSTSVKDIFTVSSKPDGTYSATYESDAGSYTAQASVPQDAFYEAASTGLYPFLLGLLPTVLTINVA